MLDVGIWLSNFASLMCIKFKEFCMCGFEGRVADVQSSCPPRCRMSREMLWKWRWWMFENRNRSWIRWRIECSKEVRGRGRGDWGGKTSLEKLVCASKMAEPAGDVAACFLLFLFSSFYLEFAILQALIMSCTAMFMTFYIAATEKVCICIISGGIIVIELLLSNR